MSTNGNNNWRDLAERASKETDSEQLVKLIAELCDAIDHHPRQQAKPVNKKSDIIPADD